MLRNTLLVLAAGGLCSVANAQVINISAVLDGLQETPPNASPGFGTMTGTYDLGTNLLSWNIVFAGLTAPVTAAHFHQAPPGVAGPVHVPIPIGGGSPFIGNAFITEAQEAELLLGNWYINIHTQTFPGGEIRGQVQVPAPTSLAIVGAAGLLASRRRR